MRFKYHKYDLPHPFKKNKHLLRPLIPLSIGRKNNTLRFEALIDSGSDFNIFPIELADRLGIKLRIDRKVYFSGIESDTNEGFISSTTLSIGQHTFDTKVIFSDAVISNGILGQYGFFDKFTVSFDLKRREIEINPKT